MFYECQSNCSTCTAVPALARKSPLPFDGPHISFYPNKSNKNYIGPGNNELKLSNPPIETEASQQSQTGQALHLLSW